MAAPKAKPGPKPGRKPGRKPGPKPAATVVPHKTRGTFKQTASEFILGLVKTPRTTSEVNAAWRKIGRGGKADITLSQMVKAGKLKRVKLKDAKGSSYSVA